MGRISRIEGIINSTINAYSHIKIFPRGLPRFVDPLLRGNIRFAKRTGNTISVMNPDNTFEFETAPQQRDDRITLELTSEWLAPDAIVSIGPGRELHQIVDVIDNVVLLRDVLAQAFTLEDQLLLHSFPMLNVANSFVGDTSVTVKSHYKLANGDTFAYLLTQELLQSLTEIKVIQATRLGTTTDPFYSELYRLELDAEISRDIPAQELIFHRAYPAYFSSSIRVPNSLFTPDPIGPFLLDLLSGKLLEGTEFPETFAIKTLTQAGSYILGTSTDYVTIDNNFPIFDRSLTAHSPMFWEIAEGTMRLTPNRVVFKVNDENKFVLGHKCIPPIPEDHEWRLSVFSNEDCTIRFIFNPHPFQEFTLLSGITQTLTVTIPPGADVTDIEINILANSNICEVQLADWSPTQNIVDQIEYSFVADVSGQATWQSTGLVIKPYFIGSEFLKATWDSGDEHDGGKVWF